MIFPNENPWEIIRKTAKILSISGYGGSCVAARSGNIIWGAQKRAWRRQTTFARTAPRQDKDRAP
jgi:hypothetical protein